MHGDERGRCIRLRNLAPTTRVKKYAMKSQTLTKTVLDWLTITPNRLVEVIQARGGNTKHNNKKKRHVEGENCDTSFFVSIL